MSRRGGARMRAVPRVRASSQVSDPPSQQHWHLREGGVTQCSRAWRPSGTYFLSFHPQIKLPWTGNLSTVQFWDYRQP